MKISFTGLSLVAGAGCLLATNLLAANFSSEWKNAQQLQVLQAGLVKISLPAETLGAARPGLEDLRIFDDAGHEVPYHVERSRPVDKVVRDARSFQISLAASETSILLETGITQPVEGVTLNAPARSFIKSVRVEGSRDRQTWQRLAQGQPIFRQAYGPSQLYVAFPPGAWPFLRLTVDDRRSEPVPFSGARIHGAALEPSPLEPVLIAIAERIENPGETRLTLNLGAAHLQLARLRIETSDTLFTREVTAAVRRISENAVIEQALARGTIYRLAIEGQPASSNLSFSVEAAVPSNDLLLLIQNHDSPPLRITGITAERRPVYVVFHAPQSSPYHLLTGHAQCPAPRYDLAALGSDLEKVAVSALAVTALTANPAYRQAETLPELRDSGTDLDTSSWRYRKQVKLTRTGVQQLELDWETLAHAQAGFQDLRLVRQGKQVSYILEQTSITRAIMPQVGPANDPKTPKTSRWSVKLLHASLPLTRLTCASSTPLFRREVILSEEATDERGAKYVRSLGQASWVQTPGQPTNQLVLFLSNRPFTDTLFLETNNEDNPAIKLGNFQVFYPATRLLFKASSSSDLFLYYGNREAGFPQYDLSLVGSQLLTSEKSAAALAGEEQLKKLPWSETSTATGLTGFLFWGVLGLVVAALLVVIARLLPKSTPAERAGTPGKEDGDA
ncbi:MAG: DUF3999 family protein [Verrucomicrobiota bacterium]